MRFSGIGFAAAGAMAVTLITSSPAEAQISVTRTTSYAYSNSSIPNFMTNSNIEPGSPTTLEVETIYTPDSFGNVRQKTIQSDPRNTGSSAIQTRNTSATYDAQGRFATTTTNELSQNEGWAYDPRFGTQTSHTDLNNLTTATQFDSFGRKVLEQRPDGTQTSWTYTLCSGSCPANGLAGETPAYQVTALIATQAAPTTPIAPTVTTTYDSLNRAIVEDVTSFDNTTVSRVAIQYDQFGRVSQKTRPYYPGGTQYWTVETYDTMNRVTVETAPDTSTIRYAYATVTASAEPQVTKTDELNNNIVTVTNSQSEIISVTDALSHATAYWYDPFGNLLEVVDPLNNVVSMTYDIRGRKTAMLDPDLGGWTYAYDVLSELKSQTDAKGQTTSLAYDLRMRMTQRAEPDVTSSWTYDTVVNGKGLLASAATTNGYGRVLGYDTLSRPSSVTLSIANQGNAQTCVNGAGQSLSSCTIGLAYDADGRLSSYTYPSGFGVTYAYNGAGYMSQVKNTGSGALFWTANAEDAEFHLTQQTFGNGIVENQGYYGTTGRLQTVQAGAGNAVANFSYTWDAFGNLTQRVDAIDNITEAITPDALNRISTVAMTGATTGNLSVTYDAIGNITSKSDVGTYTNNPSGFGVALPHGIGQLNSGANWTYDSNGNLTGDTTRTLTYTAANQPATMQEGSNTLTFSYDTEHQRFLQIEPGNVATVYFSAGGILAEAVTGSGGAITRWNDYIFVGSEMIAVYYEPIGQAAYTRYYHKDHLGSVAALTDDSGTVQQRMSYDAWGKQRNINGSADTTCSLPAADQTTRTYTGQETLAAVCLIHMNARAYDPQIGKFTSPDSEIDDPTDSQAYNRFAYVHNRPLVMTDPTGHDAVDTAIMADPDTTCYGSCGGFGGLGSSGGSDAGVNTGSVAANEQPGQTNQNSSPSDQGQPTNNDPPPADGGQGADTTSTTNEVVVQSDRQRPRGVQIAFMPSETDGLERLFSDNCGGCHNNGMQPPPPPNSMSSTQSDDKTAPAGQEDKQAQNNQLDKNKAQGKAGEVATEESLGDKVAGKQVTIKTSKGTTARPDFVTTDKGVVETKTGNAGLSQGQKDLQNDINAGRPVTPVGKNAAGAGLTPGQPTNLNGFKVDRPF